MRTAAVEDHLPRVRRTVAVFARLVAVDQQFGADLLRKGFGIGGTKIAAPDEAKGRAAAAIVGTSQRSIEHGCVERIAIALVGQAMADEDAAGEPDRQRAGREEFEIGVANAFAR